jgi:hypothetical protein
MELSFCQHFDPHRQIGKPLHFAGFVPQHHFDLVGPSMMMDGMQNISVKIEDVRLGHGGPFFDGYVPEGVHNRRHVDSHGALDGTGMTAHANPYGRTLQGFFLKPELYQTKNTVGRKIGGPEKRTPGGTGHAVVTFV